MTPAGECASCAPPNPGDVSGWEDQGDVPACYVEVRVRGYKSETAGGMMLPH